VDLDVDIGADAVDYKCVWTQSTITSLPDTFYSAIANQESLSGLEVEMRKLEGIVKEVVDELEYLKRREERFTDTNGTPSFIPCCFQYTDDTSSLASTNERVEKFAWFTILSLAGLGAWQILHLRSFFKRKYLID
jgi:hypothetical protein